jgi:hypothetical protein
MHGVPQPPSVIFRHTRRAVDPPKAAVAPVVRAIKRSPDMRPRPRQHQPPAVLQGIIHRRADMLVLMVVHLPVYSSTASLGEKGAYRPAGFLLAVATAARIQRSTSLSPDPCPLFSVP